MKFLRVAGVHYEPAKKQFTSLQLLSFPDQMQTVFDTHLNYGNSLTQSLKKFGYETFEILYDLEGAQKAWARENDFRWNEQNWQIEILIHQIQKIQPEILYLHNISSFPISLVQKRKEILPFLRQLIMFRGYPEINKPLRQLLAAADLLLVGSPVLERICRQNSLNPHLFYHYFDDRVLNKLGQNKVPDLFSFLGTSGYGYGWNHQPRYFFLKQLLKRSDLCCWLEENPILPSKAKEKIKRQIEKVGSWLPSNLLNRCNENCNLPAPIRKVAFNSLARKESIRTRSLEFPKEPLKSIFPERCNQSLFGLEMFEKLAASQITFNKHTFAAKDTVDNIRLFEATGVGTCLLTDSGTNLSTLFEPDREVVTYSSVEECLEKLRYLSENEKIRSSVARKGQEKTMKCHLACNRALQMHELIREKGIWD